MKLKYELLNHMKSKQGLDFLYKYRLLRRMLPVSVLIEITSRCNLRCIGCPRTDVEYKSKDKDMSFQDFKKYFDMLPWGVCSVGLNGFGEPMLHPDIEKIVRYIVKNKRGIDISFNTNLLANDIKIYMYLLNNGLTSVNISVDSFIQKDMDKIRTGTNVDKLKKRIISLLELYSDKLVFWVTIGKYNKDTFSMLTKNLISMGAKKVVYTYFISHNKKHLEPSKIERQKIYNQVMINKKDYKDKVIISPFFKDMDSPCQRVVKGIVITVDGRLQPCCFFFATPLNLGFLYKTHLKRYFFSKEWTKKYKKICDGLYPDFCYNFVDNKICSGVHKL